MRIGIRNFGADSPEIINLRINIGSQYLNLGEYGHAQELLEAAVAVKEKRGESDMDAAAALNSLGVVRFSVGDGPGAEAYYRRALAIATPILGAEHSNVAYILGGVGRALALQGKNAEALVFFDRSLAVFSKAVGPDSLVVAGLWAASSDTERQAGNLAGAKARLKRAREIVEKNTNDRDEDSLAYFQAAGRLHLALGDSKAAHRAFEKALAIAEFLYDTEHPNVSAARKRIGRGGGRGSKLTRERRIDMTRRNFLPAAIALLIGFGRRGRPRRYPPPVTRSRTRGGNA